MIIFLGYFVNKISTPRPLHLQPVLDLPPPPECSAVFQQFEPVTLSGKVVYYLRPSNSSLLLFFKETLHIIVPSVLCLINASLSSGCVPAAFKHTAVQPISKRRTLIQIGRYPNDLLFPKFWKRLFLINSGPF